MIATLDANLLASGLIAREGGTIHSILEAWQAARFRVALSQHLFGELARTEFLALLPAPNDDVP